MSSDDDYKNVKIDLDELRADIELNRQQRREFVRMYAEWLKKTPNKVWSTQHKKIEELP